MSSSPSSVRSQVHCDAANRLIADYKPKTHADKLKRDNEIILFRAGWIVGYRAAMRSRSK